MLSRGLRVFLTTDAVGGVWTYAAALCAAFSRENVGVTLAVMGPAPTDAQLAQVREAPGVAVVDTGLPLDWLAPDDDAVMLASERLAALAAADGAHVVHLHSGAYAAGPFLSPVVVSCHSCLTTWWATLRAQPMPEDFHWRGRRVGRGYRAADLLIAPTAAFGRDTARLHGLAREPEVVWNGVDPQVCPAVAETGSATAVAVGRLWDDGKDVRTLDAAAAGAKTPIDAIGPTRGPNGAAVALRHARSLGSLPGAAVRARLGGRPIFVSTAVYEPFGLAALEAAQAGCALVLTDIPTHRELWDGAALFAPPRDADAFSTAIDRLADDRALRLEFGEQARARSARYGGGRMATETLALYRQALARRAGAAA